MPSPPATSSPAPPGAARLVAHHAAALDRESCLTLDAGLRARLEWGYGCSLDGVRIHAGETADAVNRALGTLAVTWQDRVLLSRRAVAAGASARRLVLAHELAHVAQKRRPAHTAVDPMTPAYRAQLEREAADASLSALAGRRRPVRLADAPDAVAAWGPAGHYYTVYFVALAAGVNAVNAANIAFYCQMLDQVSEFDAIEVAKEMGKRIAVQKGAAAARAGLVVGAVSPGTLVLGGIAAHGLVAGTASGLAAEAVASWWNDPSMISYGETWSGRARDFGKWFQEASKEASAANPQTFEDLLNIQMGLHCLTGGDSKLETSFRKLVALSLPKTGVLTQDCALGVALHSFGDSYAHRRLDDPAKMYDWGAGHLEGMHGPDNASHPARRMYYREYGTGMYDILKLRFPTASPKLTREGLEAKLNEVSAIGEERLQALHLCGLSAMLGAQPTLEWMREIDPIPLASFQKQYASVGPLMEAQVRMLAKDWRMRRTGAQLGDFPVPTPAAKPGAARTG